MLVFLCIKKNYFNSSSSISSITVNCCSTTSFNFFLNILIFLSRVSALISIFSARSKASFTILEALRLASSIITFLSSYACFLSRALRGTSPYTLSHPLPSSLTYSAWSGSIRGSKSTPTSQCALSSSRR